MPSFDFDLGILGLRFLFDLKGRACTPEEVSE